MSVLPRYKLRSGTWMRLSARGMKLSTMALSLKVSSFSSGTCCRAFATGQWLLSQSCLSCPASSWGTWTRFSARGIRPQPIGLSLKLSSFTSGTCCSEFARSVASLSVMFVSYSIKVLSSGTWTRFSARGMRPQPIELLTNTAPSVVEHAAVSLPGQQLFSLRESSKPLKHARQSLARSTTLLML